MKDGYIVWDTATGIYDGAYATIDMAIDRYIDMSQENPDGEWVLVQLIAGNKLSDKKYHALATMEESK
jgi:hypothetical protein